MSISLACWKYCTTEVGVTLRSLVMVTLFKMSPYVILNLVLEGYTWGLATILSLMVVVIARMASARPAMGSGLGVLELLEEGGP